ncbi:class I SAM-dependent methyltransferase [Parasphingorhabdus sp.]|uniref:class I SAM-dependent methyltransferase n=1 Tax=Parasphingorhabdus sp. TaxID=2709688 RepID=UPI003D2DB29E
MSSKDIVKHYHPELDAGGFVRNCCSLAFYSRVNALLDPSFTVLDYGAGRGAQIAEEKSSYRRALITMQGKVKHVIGTDIDDAVLENPYLDERHLVEMNAPLPIADNSVDLIICDHVLEHVADPASFVAELRRVLKPGGWFCARTPTKNGYIGLGARVIPNKLHVKLLTKLQPTRKAEDVFPVTYRMNTLRDIRSAFRSADWNNCTYTFSGLPGYHANSHILFNLVRFWSWIVPKNLGAKLHIFVQKK